MVAKILMYSPSERGGPLSGTTRIGSQKKSKPSLEERESRSDPDAAKPSRKYYNMESVKMSESCHSNQSKGDARSMALAKHVQWINMG
eukprot:scaffold88967_cov53-Attheya_sp.AAC.2